MAEEPVKASTPVLWGEWMGAWKADEGKVDEEQDRLSRQNAAFGGDTSARMKDLNVLIVGCRGVGIETAKNLILSNVGSVTVWDPTPTAVEDLGANFYLGTESIGKPRASACLGQLKSLNPYCKVELLDAAEEDIQRCLAETNVLSTGKPYSVIVITEILKRPVLFALSAEARSKNIAFLMALNMGVTTSIFSDFGPKHIITDEDGEPTQMLAVSAAEVVPLEGIVKVDGLKEGDRVVVLTLASEHSLQDGDVIALDDMRGDLSAYNGKQLKVRRFGVLSPTDAKVDLSDVSTKELLKSSTGEVLANFSKQHEHWKAEFEAKGGEGKFKQREITLFNRLCLVLEDGMVLEQWASYRSGGLVNSVKPAIPKEYESLERTLVHTANPQMLDQESWHAGEGCWVHIALEAALRFFDAKGRWMGLRDVADADAFVSMAMAVSEERKALEGACWLQKVEWGFPSGEPAEDLEKIKEKFKDFSLLFRAELTGFCAFLGGAIAQEVIKKTGKFTPIEQWLHHHDPCLIGPHWSEGAWAALVGASPRYTLQAAVVGEKVMTAIQEERIFLVGCGALGCEYLKGLALMGACTAAGSKLIVTDMDRIEVSNLSRQFLFRQPDVKSPKSVTAARVVKSWNPQLQIEALEKGVGVTSEDFFDDEFWQKLHLCWNALDNVIARKYTDQCCLWYGLPLLESGTLGTKSNSDVFLPGLTKSYNDSTESDTGETQIAMCTLRSFPYLPLHCIEFAKQAYFCDYMEFAPQQYEAFRKDREGFFEQLDAMGEMEQMKSLKMIKNFITLQQAGKVDFDVCIKEAFAHYCRDFINSIRDLVYSCDQMEKSSGKPFWTGTKRRPIEAKWDPKSPPAEAMEYLYATANCYAAIWQVPFVRRRAEFERRVVALGLRVPEWTAPSDTKVDVEGEEDKADPAVIEELKKELYAFDPAGLLPCEAHDFEKDDDANFHIDFLTASTNLRSANYDIKKSDRAHVKVTAGRIIPALATTTAMICGLVDVEFIKLAKGLHKSDGALDKFYNANVNLATGSQAMNIFRPEPPLKKKSKLATLPEFSTWDKLEIEGDITLKELVEHLEGKFGVTVQRIFPAGEDKLCIFDSGQVKKLGWKIELAEDGKAIIEPEEVFTAWPQLRMATQMLQRMPAGPSRKNFEGQVLAAAKSLQSVKDTFAGTYGGKVSQAYVNAARPKDDAEKQKYFDAVFQKRSYIALQAHITNSEGEEADVPVIGTASGSDSLCV
eukprot:CAMPEP_0170591992 /NCGR_PEP_ID=MMETSP0224-20130122/12696_1 /TAXON_ID=285029 /ORGANISM="Togula jolla, Strain CCCM 725" /LENGTH=1235 /DNA_ID=CAMNT_0010915887 /DNA_START=54 /DNA_END=3762 /DNA_ORIENTATION=-